MSRVAVLIVVLVVGSGLGLWYFTKNAKPTTNTTTTTNATSNSALNTTNAATTVTVSDYRDSQTGFDIRYPSDWKKTEDTSGEGENAIRNITFTGASDAVTITVVAASFEGIIRESISVQQETAITLNDVPATRLDAGSARDGSPKTVVLVKRGITLISLNGHGPAFERLLTTFRWPEPNTPIVPE